VSKYDSFVYDYLVANKILSIEKMGIVELTGPVPMADKDNPTPTLSSSIKFSVDKKAATSDEFIDYVAQAVGKKKTLIYSDIESYFEQARQFINIGKPFIIPNVGIISINKQGVYEFKVAEPSMHLEDHPSNAGTSYDSGEIAKTSARLQQKNMIRVIASAIGILIVFVLLYIAYGYFKNNTKEVANVNTDTASTIIPIDTTANTTAKPDTIITNNTITSLDTLELKYIFEVTGSRNRAIARCSKLKMFGDPAHYDSIVYADSTQYRLFLTITTAVTDTAKYKDSIQRYFQRKVFIEQ